jgi:hypothetical protein
LIAVLALFVAAASALVYTRRKTKWRPGYSENEGTLLFNADLTPHPGHYSVREQLDIWRQVTPARLVTDPAHWREYPSIYRFTFTSGFGARIGKPAPGFDLPTSDGKRIRLSDLRGKNVALMFAAET